MESPRGLTGEEVAFYLGLSRASLDRLLPELLKDGFPKMISILKRYDKEAIDRWFDSQSGLVQSLLDEEAALDARIDAYGEGQGPWLAAGHGGEVGTFNTSAMPRQLLHMP